MGNSPMHQDEYTIIAELESKHWWYKSLHELVLSTLKQNFDSKEISIIDAGCGTGGLMAFLRSKGYKNIKGFDISEIAVKFCNNKDLDVFEGNLKDISTYFPADSADVIISNDTFYFLDDAEQRRTTDALYALLKEDGLVILNIPSLKAFGGIHDLRVGIDRRFSRKNVWKLLNRNRYSLVKAMYWPFLLSPGIWFARYMQRLKMKFSKAATVSSDLKSGNKIVNEALLLLTGLENRFMYQKPFGSSLFLVAKVKH